MNIPFKTRLEEAEDDLLSLTRRLYAQEAFLGELNQTTRLKPFRIWNDIVWVLLLDSRDMLVIHLASWARALYRRGGLFSQIQAHHLREFPAQRRKSDDPQVDESYRKDLETKHREVFEELFPDCNGYFPSCNDLCSLRDRFAAEMSPVVNDRSNNRAHPYEMKGESANSTMLDLASLRVKVDYSSRVLNRIRVLSLDSSMNHGDMNSTSSSETAEELVDALLLGPVWRQRFVRGDADRQAYYGQLHRRHDALMQEPKPLFNDAFDEP